MRYVEPDDVAEDGPEDTEDHAHSVHTCGWNGSLGPYRRADAGTPVPCPATQRERLERARAVLRAKVAEQKARGLIV